MISIDLAIVLLILIGSLWGMTRGAWQQFLDAFVWLMSCMVPWLFATSLAKAIERPLQVPFSHAFAYSALALVLLTQIALRLMIQRGTAAMAARKARAAERQKSGQAQGAFIAPGALDRVAGALLGATKVAALIWIGLSLTAVVNVVLVRRGVMLKITDSSFFQLAVHYNAFWMFFGEAAEKISRSLPP